MKRVNFFKNPWNYIFVVDPVGNINLSYCTYESDSYASKIITQENKDVVIYNAEGNVPVYTCDFENEEQFNKHVMNAILKAYDISKSVDDNFSTVKANFDHRYAGISCILISQEDKNCGTLYKQIIQEVNEYVAERRVFAFPEIKSGEAYVFADPEYFGVLCEQTTDNNNYQYGVGIMNTSAIVKVKFDLNNE